MKLNYRDLPATASDRPAVVLHDRGAASADQVAGLAEASGSVGRMVVPFGDYGFTASGMELAGICWYRTVPGFVAPDPLTVARAVVQVGDLMDDLALDGPALIGRGQGAVVAIGTGLLQPDRVSAVVAIDVVPGHLPALPARLRLGGRCPPLLLLTTDGSSVPGGEAGLADAVEADDRTLAAIGTPVTRWQWAGGDDQDRDKATSEQIGRWLADD